MRKQYDFSKAGPNLYARRLKKTVTIRIDDSSLDYFKRMAEESGIPYQTLINMYLRDCAATGRKLNIDWN
ncbi:BrnA antitoxin family protein [Orrella daihaiensis]|uniref:BrnA antitoxin family protein n=1 Tax=Orrella daihaiensis TaxID=2782176 RepID=A0ABY4AMY8_9BURK|nr:BrnA antitoxin family protein [Orrella daihaiensis]UOD51398.1 BrnA antitoxin family protein [Orrella daihaiensis]